MKKRIIGLQFSIFIIVLIFGLFACAPPSAPAELTVTPSLDLLEEATHTPQPLTGTVPPTQALTNTPTETELPPVSTNTPIPANTPIPTQTAAPTASKTEPTDFAGERYAVVGVAPRDTLNVREGAGVDSEIIDELPNTAVGVRWLGDTVTVDESEWVEIQYEDVSGWVNASFLAFQYGEGSESAATALEIIYALKIQDFATLSTFVHPEKGVRFTPYAYVRTEDIVLSQVEVASITSNTRVYLWGRFDGTGDPIQLTFADYYLAFIYDVDFFQPNSIGWNESIGYSNDINNIFEFYPEAEIVEYYFPGFNARYDGMDWRGLRVVLEEENGAWYLVGIVHTEWTI